MTGRSAPVRAALIPLGLAALLLLARGSSLTPPRLLVSEVLERVRSGRPVTDAGTWARLAAEFPTAEEYVFLLRARSEMPGLEAVRTLRGIIDLRPSSPAAFEAHLTLARHWAGLGDARAQDAYRWALELDDSTEVRLEWAGYLEATGRPDEAYQMHADRLAESPEAFVDMRRLARDRVALAQDLVSATYFSDALEVLREAQGLDVDRLRARALSGLGRFEEALPLFERWLQEEPESDQARLGLARILSRLGRLEEALALYQTVDSQDARLAAGGLLQLMGETEAALALYREHTYPVALWRATEILERDDRAHQTLELYDRIAASGSEFADDAAYRLLVLARRLGQPEAEAQALTRLQEIVGPNFFWELAGGRDFGPGLAALPADEGSKILAKAETLREMGLDAWALQELRFAARLGQGTGLLLATAAALHDRGRITEAHRIAQNQILSRPVPAPFEAWRLSYPSAYRVEVEAAAAEFGVDPLLVWSVMRQESQFDPMALSSADAQGLMQIIPSTRDDIASRLAVSVGPLDMFDPAANIRFGASYLRTMLDVFEDDPLLAVAAYNGGPGNVRTWLGDPVVSEQADFLRWIGLSETREFVARVMANYAVYRWLETV